MASDPYTYAEQFGGRVRRRRLQSTQTGSDPLALEIDRMRREELQDTFQALPPPDTIARASRLAREADVEPFAVDGQEDRVEAAMQGRRFADLATRYPAIGKFALSDRRAAAAARDDTDAIASMLRAVDPETVGGEWDARKRAEGWAIRPVEVEPTFGNFARGVLESLVGGFKQLREGGTLALDEMLPEESYISPTAKRVSREGQSRDFRAAQADIDLARPQFESATMAGVYSGVSSLAQMTPAIIASIGTRSPYPAVMIAGAQTAAPAYGKYRARGATVGEARLGAAGEGTVEAAFELLPMGTLARGFGKQGAGRFVAEFFGKELATEQLTTLAQDAIDTAIANPDKTWSDYWAERPAAAYETAVATLVSTGALGALNLAANRSKARGQLRDIADAEGFLLDRMAEAAAGSKLRKRMPEAFSAMLDTITEGMAADKVYIPADAVRELMQSEGFEETNWWREKAQDIADAEAMGGDLVLPVSEAMTHLSDPSTWNALRKDMRLSPGGYSRAEMESVGEEAANFDNELADLVGERSNDPRSTLFAVAFQKLTDAGYTSNAAQAQAEFITERYATRAERRGEELTGREFDAVGIEYVLPERVKAAAKSDALDLVIAAMRGGKETKASGPSLLEWIAARGGIEDRGGNITSMGGDKWHREKAFRRRLLKPFEEAQGNMIGRADDTNSIEALFDAAVSEGFFPDMLATREAGEALDSNAFLDAIGSELRGSPVLRDALEADSTTGQMREAGEELKQLLAEYGYDPDTMADADVRAFVDRFEKGDAQGRSYASGERGRILFQADGRAIIQLFKSRNLSTFLHESGHLFLEELREDATREGASAQLQEDWAIVEQWFADNGAAAKGGTIPTEAHELWARGFERRLMEGNAPSEKLAGVFETFRSWLVAIYRRARNLKAPITDDIRGVMDRLVATDDVIADKREQQGLDPLFAEMASAGMSKAEFDAYMDLVAQSKNAADSELLGKALAGLKAAETAQYREQEVAVRAEVTKAIDNRPAFRALDAVRSDPLNRQWIADRMGEDALGLMPRGVPPSVKEGGANPDALAEAVGLADGRELVETLIGMEKRRREMRANGDKRTVRAATIEAETLDAMSARYGDPFASGEVEAAALAAVHNDMQGEVLAAEVRALARRAGGQPMPYSMARAWARRKVRGGEVRDHLSGAALQQYRRAAAANAHEAFDAVARGDMRAALRHKQAQLVNNALVREARDAGKELDEALRRLSRTSRRKTIVGVSQDYLDQAHALLETVDLKKRSGRQVDRQESFEAWASAREEEGHTIAVPRSFATTIGKTNWTKLAADDLLGLDDAVRQVIHLGRLKQTLIDKQEERELDKVVTEARNTMDRLPLRKTKGFEDPTRWDDIKSGALGVHAALLKMETIFERLDGSHHGAFNRVVFQPISEAQAREHEKLTEVLAELEAHAQAVPKEIRATWTDQITIASLYDPRTKEPIKGPRSKLIAMALNVGNESNAQKLAGGYGWRQDEVMRVLDAELAPEEWRYVQNVWDTIEKLWPEIVALEKRVNGIAPDKVIPRRVNTSAGILRGGYYPVVFDPERSRISSEQAERNRDRLFENNYQRASTSRGFTKERTTVERPIHLSLDVMNRHVAEVIHDLTHREPVMQADRFLSDQRVLDAVDETLGPDVSGLFRPWLQHVANEWAYDRAGVGKLEAVMRAARRNTTFVGMAYRIGTIMAQVGGYANSIERVGLPWIIRGLGVSLRNPGEANRFAIERSKELKTRFGQQDRDMRENQRRLAGKTDVASLVQRYAYSGISAFDRLVAVPTWLGAYNKAIAAGMEEDAAAHEADSAVRESQGAGAAKDLAAIQRGRGPAGELGKSLTMFYSFQSAQYNRLVKLGWDVGDARREGRIDAAPELAARAMVLTLLVPVLGSLLGGRGPDEDNEEGWAEWAAKESLYGLAAPVPFLRDVVPVATKKVAGDTSYGYRFTPIAGVGESIERVAGDVNKLREGRDTTRATRNALEAAGYLTGVVPGQAAATAQFVVDVSEGEVEPDGMAEWWEGVRTGKVKE